MECGGGTVGWVQIIVQQPPPPLRFAFPLLTATSTKYSLAPGPSLVCFRLQCVLLSAARPTQSDSHESVQLTTCKGTTRHDLGTDNLRHTVKTSDSRGYPRVRPYRLYVLDLHSRAHTHPCTHAYTRRRRTQARNLQNDMHGNTDAVVTVRTAHAGYVLTRCASEIPLVHAKKTRNPSQRVRERVRPMPVPSPTAARRPAVRTRNARAACNSGTIRQNTWPCTLHEPCTQFGHHPSKHMALHAAGALHAHSSAAGTRTGRAILDRPGRTKAHPHAQQLRVRSGQRTHRV